MNPHGVWSQRWAFPDSSAPGRACMSAVDACAPLLLQPYNSISRMGFGMRRSRLRSELLEFSFRYRLRTGSSPNVAQLIAVGELLIGVFGSGFALDPLPVEKDLFVNSKTMPFLMPAGQR